MKSGKNIIGIILSIIVIIAFFGLELLLGIERPINKTMEIENLSEIMEEIDIERIFRDEKGNQTAMGTRIYHYFDDIGLSKAEVDSVVKDKSFKKIIGTYLGTMFMNGINGTEVIYPKKAELVNFIHNNYKHFQKVSGFPKNYKQSEIEKIVDDNYGNVKYELVELSKDIKFDEISHIDLVKKVLSTKTMLIIGGLVLCIILLIIFRASFYRWLKWVSFPTMLSGLILIIGGFVGNRVVNLFVDFDKYEFILSPVITDMFKNMRLFGILEIVLGVIALIIYFIINKVFKKPAEELKIEELGEQQEEL